MYWGRQRQGGASPAGREKKNGSRGRAKGGPVRSSSARDLAPSSSTSTREAERASRDRDAQEDAFAAMMTWSAAGNQPANHNPGNGARRSRPMTSANQRAPKTASANQRAPMTRTSSAAATRLLSGYRDNFGNHGGGGAGKHSHGGGGGGAVCGGGGVRSVPGGFETAPETARQGVSGVRPTASHAAQRHTNTAANDNDNHHHHNSATTTGCGGDGTHGGTRQDLSSKCTPSRRKRSVGGSTVGRHPQVPPSVGINGALPNGAA